MSGQRDNSCRDGCWWLSNLTGWGALRLRVGDSLGPGGDLQCAQCPARHEGQPPQALVPHGVLPGRTLQSGLTAHPESILGLHPCLSPSAWVPWGHDKGWDRSFVLAPWLARVSAATGPPGHQGQPSLPPTEPIWAVNAQRGHCDRLPLRRRPVCTLGLTTHSRAPRA